MDALGYYGTTGVGPDLFVNAQNAMRAMIEHIDHDLRPLAARTRTCCAASPSTSAISEIVDAGEYVVSALLPESVFAIS